MGDAGRPLEVQCGRSCERELIMSISKGEEMSTLPKPTLEDSYTLAHFPMALGEALRHLPLRYALDGKVNQARDNAILVCHALSGSAQVADWWPGVVGPGCSIDTERYCIIGVNVIGSCYGSTGPSSLNPETGKPYGGSFPLITIRDMVQAQAQLLREQLGVEHLHTVIGGLLGRLAAFQKAGGCSRMGQLRIVASSTPPFCPGSDL